MNSILEGQVTDARRAAPVLTSSDQDLAFVMLGRMIRRLRESRGLTQQQLAAAMNSTQGNISKYETAQLRLDAHLVSLLGRALAASAQEQRELKVQFALTRKSASSYGVIFGGGADEKQKSIGVYEQASRTIDEYEPSIIPGLLQVPSYTREVMKAFRVPAASIERATAERAKRQVILSQPQRRFHFIVSEVSLHTVPGARESQIEQLESLLLLHFARANTSIGILPLEGGTIPLAMTGFIVFDSMFATAETTVDEQQIKDPSDVRVLVNLHRELSQKAVYGEDAMLLIRKAVKNLSV